MSPYWVMMGLIFFLTPIIVGCFLETIQKAVFLEAYFC